MKKGKGVNELLDLIFSEDLSVSRLKKLGFSEEDAIEFLSMLHQDNSKYMRVLNKDERESFTPDAMIYLLSMLQSGSIDRETFEDIVSSCMEIVYFTREKLDKETVDNVVNHVIFNKSRDVSLKDLIDRVFLNENEIEFDDEVH